MLALAGQIGGNAAATPGPDTESPRARLQAAMVLCLGGTKPADGGQHPIHHHLPDLAIAGALHHFAPQPAVEASETHLQPPSMRQARWAHLPPARAPPPCKASSTYPTGPPTRLI